ncbi:MAG: NAD-dependent protein deacylase, partial [Muribaculaceae bacterium]|nr:NAD-dependent protein deacylase [Muribaculaceae bacterium]
LFTLTPPDLSTTPQTLIEGHHVRPHIVFFEEAVPMIEPAAEVVAEADILVIVGTSLNVYPAAGLMHYARPGIPVFYIDPRPAAVSPSVRVIPQPATKGMQTLAKLLEPLK